MYPLETGREAGRERERERKTHKKWRVRSFESESITRVKKQRAGVKQREKER